MLSWLLLILEISEMNYTFYFWKILHTRIKLKEHCLGHLISEEGIDFIFTFFRCSLSPFLFVLPTLLEPSIWFLHFEDYFKSKILCSNFRSEFFSQPNPPVGAFGAIHSRKFSAQTLISLFIFLSSRFFLESKFSPSSLDLSVVKNKILNRAFWWQILNTPLFSSIHGKKFDSICRAFFKD